MVLLCFCSYTYETYLHVFTYEYISMCVCVYSYVYIYIYPYVFMNRYVYCVYIHAYMLKSIREQLLIVFIPCAISDGPEAVAGGRHGCG